MVEQNKTLAEYLYDNLHQNSYLKKLIQRLLLEYSYYLFDANWSLAKKEKIDLLKFADLLSKAKDPRGSADCKNLSLRIIALLNEMFPEDPSVNLVSNSVLRDRKSVV